MTLRSIPKADGFVRPKNFQWEIPSDVLDLWAAKPLTAEKDAENTITIFDVIGDDYYGSGFTAKRMDAALRSIGQNPVKVKINSPGGDMFEGIAIYNLLRGHKAEVSVEVMGWAASAASIIAMAGDNISMGTGSFMMVHNCWSMVIGNRHDLAEAAKVFEGFDNGIADIYQGRTELGRDDIFSLMDNETFMGPTEAKENGFADHIDELLVAKTDETAQSKSQNSVRILDAKLAQTGMSRNERRKLISNLKSGRQDAADNVTRDADEKLLADVRQFTKKLKMEKST